MSDKLLEGDAFGFGLVVVPVLSGCVGYIKDGLKQSCRLLSGSSLVTASLQRMRILLTSK